ncbi:MAG: hypothetical protein IT210_21680, partial [Armatimonadetes bacterium]|nr:hypothetical protein [Armatimonadota bacterium]
AACILLLMPPEAARSAPKTWKIGTPIVTYWAGPGIADETARQMAAGGWNLAWCGEKELDILHKYRLRAQLLDGLLSPASLDDPEKKARLDALIERVRKHPALYAYYIVDEPNAAAFPGLGKLVAYLKERDPAHLAYINLFPTYANNEQLGTAGDTVTAYAEHLRQYVEVVRPALVSYDHYHFLADGTDGGQYFLNLAMIRKSALDAGVPFLNIVQAFSFAPSMRTPTGDEIRWLTYTSLAYGAQGLSHFIYVYPPGTPQTGGLNIATEEFYRAMQAASREFVTVARQLQPLRSLGAYHAGMVPLGAEPLPAKAAFSLTPPLQAEEFKPPRPVSGILLGYFGKQNRPTHVLAVNLDYKNGAAARLTGPGPLQIFNVRTKRWSDAEGPGAKLNLPPGGGVLVRLKS